MSHLSSFTYLIFTEQSVISHAIRWYCKKKPDRLISNDARSIKCYYKTKRSNTYSQQCRSEIGTEEKWFLIRCGLKWRTWLLWEGKCYNIERYINSKLKIVYASINLLQMKIEMVCNLLMVINSFGHVGTIIITRFLLIVFSQCVNFRVRWARWWS